MKEIPIPKAHKPEEYQTMDLEKLSSTIAYHLMTSIVVPRPIAFITSCNAEGVVNAAPFSYFNAVCSDPPIVSISISRRGGVRKDTAENIVTMKEFVINACSVSMAKAISVASGDFPPQVSEVELTKLSLMPSTKVSVPRVANSLVQMECRLHRLIEVGNEPVDFILGEIVEIHVHKDILSEKDRVDIRKLDPLARLSGSSFATLGDFFDIPRGL